MRIAVLGPLEVWGDDGGPVPVPGAKERLLLAVLAASAGRVVSTDRLTDVLWDGQEPATARKSLQIYVVRLRSALEPQRPRGSPGRFVVRRGAGYALAVSSDDVDAERAAHLVAKGRALLAAGEAGEAERSLTEALALWRGTPYGDWPGSGFADAERRRLHEIRLAALGGLLEARLALGRHVEVVPDAEALVAEDPLREDSWRLLMLALYRGDRQSEALAAAAEARRVLREEVGADPGPVLRHLEAAVLAQDPSLELPPPPADEGAGPLRSATCPYKGLATYQREDAALFSGRDRMIRTLVARLVDAPLLAVSGPSGAGKSSVIRAGLLPVLAAGALPGSEGWCAVVLTPGRRPVDELAPLAGEPPPERAVVLVCDQFEELWAPGVDPAERTAFLDTVLTLLDDRVVVRCVVVVRGDFVGRLAEHAAFTDRMGSRLVLVPPLTDEELRQVVREPARAVGLSVDEDLVDAVVADVRGRPGALPLLSTALVGTWERRRADSLTLAGYLEAGGVAGALAASAESAWAGLDGTARETARRLLVRMADTDDSGSLIRRAVPLDELDLEGEQGLSRRAVVDAFVSRRLLTVDGDRLDVAHEALLSAWPRLVRWLEDDAAGRAVRRHLAPAAAEWARRGEPEEELYRGARLAAALDWAATASGELTAVEERFLSASRERADQELQEAKDRARREAAGRRRTRRLATGLAAVLVAALVAGGVAVRAQRDAERASLVADANRLAALSTTAGSLDAALLLAVQAQRLASTPETEDALLAVLARHPRAVRAVPLPGRVLAAELADGGGSVLALVGHAEVVGWQVGGDTEPRVVARLEDNPWGGLTTLAGAPDQDAVVVAGVGLPEPWVGVVDGSGENRVLAEGDVVPGIPLAVQWTEDGDDVLLVTGADAPGSTATWQLSLVDPIGGAVRPTSVRGSLPAPADQLSADVADDDTSWAVVAAGDASDGSLVDLRDGGVVPIEWEPREAGLRRLIALSSGAAQIWDDGTVQLYDRSGRPTQLLTAHADPVRDVVLSPDGAWGATVGEAGAVVLWDVDPPSGRWERREQLAGHRGDVVDAAIDPSGTQLFTASVDDTLVTWDMRPDRIFGSETPPLEERYVSNRPQWVEPENVLVTSTRSVGAMSGDRRYPTEDTLGVAATFVEPDTGRVLEEVDVGQTLNGASFGSSVSVSPDRSMVAVTWGLGATVLDARTREELETVRLPPLGRDVNDDGSVVPAELVWCAAWTPDGSRLLLGVEGRLRDLEDGGLVVIDTSTWDRVERLEIGAPQSVELSPDERVLAVAGEDTAQIQVLDARTLAVRRTVPLPDDSDLLYDLSFSDDGRLLAAGGEFGLLFVLDTETWRWHAEPANLHDNSILQVEWLPDGRTVAAAGADGRVTLFDTDRGLVRAIPLPASSEPGEGFAHLVPGMREDLRVLSGERPGRRYPLEPAEWLDRACAVVGRDLTEAEWERYLPGRPHRPTCTDLR